MRIRIPLSLLFFTVPWNTCRWRKARARSTGWEPSWRTPSQRMRIYRRSSTRFNRPSAGIVGAQQLQQALSRYCERPAIAATPRASGDKDLASRCDIRTKCSTLCGYEDVPSSPPVKEVPGIRPDRAPDKLSSPGAVPEGPDPHQLICLLPNPLPSSSSNWYLSFSPTTKNAT